MFSALKAGFLLKWGQCVWKNQWRIRKKDVVLGFLDLIGGQRRIEECSLFAFCGLSFFLLFLVSSFFVPSVHSTHTVWRGNNQGGVFIPPTRQAIKSFCVHGARSTISVVQFTFQTNPALVQLPTRTEWKSFIEHSIMSRTDEDDIRILSCSLMTKRCQVYPILTLAFSIWC